MDADEHGLRFEQETGEIISCAFEVLNTLGHGLLEKPYENSLCVEFEVGEYIPDLVVFGFVVVDTKVIERITDHELGQMLNYLKITGHPVGLILNFKRGRLAWKACHQSCQVLESVFTRVHPWFGFIHQRNHRWTMMNTD